MKNYTKLEQFAERVSGILTQRHQSSNIQNREILRAPRKKDDREYQKGKKLTNKTMKSQLNRNNDTDLSPRYVMKNNNDKNLIIVKNNENNKTNKIDTKIIEKEPQDKKRLCSSDLYFWSQISYELEHGETINLKYCS